MQIIQDYSQGDCQESLPPSCKRHGFFLLAVAVADRVLGRKAAPPPSNNHRIYQQQPRSVPQGYILPDIPGPTSSQMYQTQPLPWPRPDFPVETSSAGLNSSGQIMTVIWPSALLLLAGVTMVTLVDRQVLVVGNSLPYLTQPQHIRIQSSYPFSSIKPDSEPWPATWGLPSDSPLFPSFAKCYSGFSTAS